MAASVIVAFVLAAVIYVMPGLVFLRRSELDLVTRVLAAAGIGVTAVTAAGVVLGAAGILGGISLALTLVVLTVGGLLAPLPAGSFDRTDGERAVWPLVAAAGFGAFMVFQALRPAIFRLNDAVAVWAELARSIGDTGDVAPGWLPTLLEGAAPSISLVAGSISLLAGGFAEAHGFIAHPLFATLYLVASVELGRRLGGRSGAWLTLLLVLSTPLLVRGTMMHDDLLAASLTVLTMLLALRAQTWQGWAIVGAVAGGAVAIKPLGVVALALAFVVLVARRPPRPHWLAVGVASLIGAPHYVWNVVRFGNPVHPLLPGVFGEPAEIRVLIADATAAVQSEDRALFGELGGLALALLAIAVVALAVAAVRGNTANPVDRRMRIGLVVLAAAFTAAWQVTGYASRHTLQLIPVVGAAGFASLFELRPRRRDAIALVAAAAVALAALTAWDVQQDFFARRDPPEAAQTGVFSVMQGKWRDLRRFVAPPQDEMVVFGPIAEAWAILGEMPPEPLVFSWDHRRYYIPQQILSGGDIDALEVYDEPDAEGRHRALRKLGVGYVLDRRARGLRHPLFDQGPWDDTRSRDDLYRELFRGGGIRLYEVLETDAGG